MYANGQGVTKDEAEAVNWWRKSAEQGNADAQFNLGLSYDNGLGVTKDEAEAVKWYRKAAEQGNANAQSNLGFMYANATPVSRAKRGTRRGTRRGGMRLQICLRMLNLPRAGWVLDFVFIPAEWQVQTQSGQRFFNSCGMLVISVDSKSNYRSTEFNLI
jgi:hypothetical protein